ncbi:hypothetical protein ACQ4LE_003417 [Meloidogyne hapla]|uniref:Ion_trans_2 domain-containing protein n=1 Tax=Meloidogyne hapla TaxID=6305 RepID=A0A1I8BK44_MELHA
MVKFGSSFELSFRRSIFSLILLFIYLIISTLIISLIGQFELLKSGNLNKLCKGKKEIQRGRRLDFERNELLNTLWADSLAVRTESDWKQLANAKFDSYERMILSSKISNNYKYCSGHSTTHYWDFISSLRSAFLLISTVGESTQYNQKQFSGTFVQLISIFISLFGIPLLLIHLEHSIKAIYAFCEDNFERPNLAIIWIFIANILIITLFVDIILEEENNYLEFNENDEKHSFFDTLFSVFLLSFTISKNLNLNKITIWLFLPLCLFLFSVNGCLIKYLIELIHNWMAPHEFAFANGFCGKVERAVSGVDIHIEEINNEEDTNSDFKRKTENQNSANGMPTSPHFLIGGENEGEVDPNNPTTNQLFAALMRRKSISTIAEEEGELPNSP